MEPHLLGIDLGTSSVKLGVYDRKLRLRAVVRREYPTRVTPDGGAEQDAESWWVAVVDGLRELAEKTPLESVGAIGLSGFNAVLGLSHDGAQQGPAITYLDRRSSGVYRDLVRKTSGETVFRRSRNRFAVSGMWATTLAWIRNAMPDYWSRSKVFVSSSGFLAGRLAGRYVVDGSRASLTLLHDPGAEELGWDQGLCDLFGIETSKLPPIVNSWDTVGPLRRGLGLPESLKPGIPVIAGGIDSCCAALGSGVVDSSVLFDIGGSAGGLELVDTTLRTDPRLLTVRYLLPGRWASIGPLSAAGSAWKWFRDSMLGGRYTDRELIDLAEAVPPGSEGLLFRPYIAGARSPQWDEAARGSFDGITIHAGVGHFARAVLEGVAFAQRDVLTVIREEGFAPAEVRVAGGQARNRLWLQIKADVLGLPHVSLAVDESAVLGAAVLAAYGIGLLREQEDLVGLETREALRVFPDDARREAYADAYRGWVDRRSGGTV